MLCRQLTGCMSCSRKLTFLVADDYTIGLLIQPVYGEIRRCDDSQWMFS
jgi:hypothetical protein